MKMIIIHLGTVNGKGQCWGGHLNFNRAEQISRGSLLLTLTQASYCTSISDLMINLKT